MLHMYNKQKYFEFCCKYYKNMYRKKSYKIERKDYFIYDI